MFRLALRFHRMLHREIASRHLFMCYCVASRFYLSCYSSDGSWAAAANMGNFKQLVSYLLLNGTAKVYDVWPADIVNTLFKVPYYNSLSSFNCLRRK
jgi:hypothetical protein